MKAKKIEVSAKKPVKQKKFVKVLVKDDTKSLMQCGGGNLCNESK